MTDIMVWTEIEIIHANWVVELTEIEKKLSLLNSRTDWNRKYLCQLSRKLTEIQNIYASWAVELTEIENNLSLLNSRIDRNRKIFMPVEQ